MVEIIGFSILVIVGFFLGVYATSRRDISQQVTFLQEDLKAFRQLTLSEFEMVEEKIQKIFPYKPEIKRKPGRPKGWKKSPPAMQEGSQNGEVHGKP
ncbi:MAG TPA: hypothetical protein VIJ14_08150 [Rhabdochlamydiaceae bacterium]